MEAVSADLSYENVQLANQFCSLLISCVIVTVCGNSTKTNAQPNSFENLKRISIGVSTGHYDMDAAFQ